jgi:hypothetical protein
MTVPLDGDGFLRRACPTCAREFKWLPSSPTDSAEDTAPGEERSPYTCPYCGIQAPAGSWATKPQVELAHAVLMREVVGPQLEEFGRELERMNRQTGGLITFEASVQRDEQAPGPTLTESDDMRRVDFPCHPGEPLKILEDWHGDVFCLVCGTPAAVS